MTAPASWDRLNFRIVACEKCPRLIRYCRQVAERKRRAYLGQTYWGKPVPNFGDPGARLLVVGLAPAAHGGNRTGRMFTGDRSGDFLYRALWKAGFSSAPVSSGRGDGLALEDCAVTASLHCAPPANKATREELENCAAWLEETLALVPAVAFLALGGTAWLSAAKLAGKKGWIVERLPKFTHGAAARLAGGRMLIASYHPSQQNTFTGRLTEGMLDEVLGRVRGFLAGQDSHAGR
jgi:uracil-DNA glycosylase family 4